MSKLNNLYDFIILKLKKHSLATVKFEKSFIWDDEIIITSNGESHKDNIIITKDGDWYTAIKNQNGKQVLKLCVKEDKSSDVTFHLYKIVDFVNDNTLKLSPESDEE